MKKRLFILAALIWAPAALAVWNGDNQVRDGVRVVGYDNERGKGDHKHRYDAEQPYVFKDVPTLIRDFLQDLKEMEP